MLETTLWEGIGTTLKRLFTPFGELDFWQGNNSYSISEMVDISSKFLSEVDWDMKDVTDLVWVVNSTTSRREYSQVDEEGSQLYLITRMGEIEFGRPNAEERLCYYNSCSFLEGYNNQNYWFKGAGSN